MGRVGFGPSCPAPFGQTATKSSTPGDVAVAVLTGSLQNIQVETSCLDRL